MKKILRSFTFYFMLLSVFIVYSHYIGQDSHGIVLFELNPILAKLRYSNFADNMIKNGPIISCGSLMGCISIYWYIAHLITFTLYGLAIDILVLCASRYQMNK